MSRRSKEGKVVTDAHVEGTVEAREEHVIDSRGGEGEHSPHGILPQS